MAPEEAESAAVSGVRPRPCLRHRLASRCPSTFTGEVRCGALSSARWSIIRLISSGSSCRSSCSCRRQGQEGEDEISEQKEGWEPARGGKEAGFSCR